MSMNLFGWLSEITEHKSDWDSFSNEDKSQFNVYMINKYLSMNEKFIDIVNSIQPHTTLNHKTIYNLYKNLIPRGKVYLKYIKKSISKEDKNKIETLATLMELSEREISEYIYLISPEESDNILEFYGSREVKNKTKKPKKAKKII